MDYFKDENVLDKRILKTRSKIKNAFMQLMTETDLCKISVSDIAKKAKINRSTYYLHYCEVKEIMQDIEDEIAKYIFGCLEKFDATDIYASTYILFCKLSAEFEKNAILKNYILFSTNSAFLTKRLKEIFTEKLLAAYLENFKTANLPLTTYKVNFVTAGILDTYLNWSRNEESSVTLEELCSTFSQTVEFLINNK